MIQAGMVKKSGSVVAQWMYWPTLLGPMYTATMIMIRELTANLVTVLIVADCVWYEENSAKLLYSAAACYLLKLLVFTKFTASDRFIKYSHSLIPYLYLKYLLYYNIYCTLLKYTLHLIM